MSDARVEIFTDGACLGNPGPGGWAAILRTGKTEKELSGGERATTNNRMELMAAIRALEALKMRTKVTLHTDSRYVMDGITIWLTRWKTNGWKTADKKPVKNADLWRELETQAARHDIDWRWVRGHSGHAENERVDMLARAAISFSKRQLMEPEATKELARLERLAEEAYSKMYDTPPLRSAKDAYDDACMYFHQAIEEAKRLGIASEVERLTKRCDHVRAVYNSQFRM